MDDLRHLGPDIEPTPEPLPEPAPARGGDGLGCHAGAAELKKAAAAAGKSETLARYDAD